MFKNKHLHEITTIEPLLTHNLILNSSTTILITTDLG